MESPDPNPNPSTGVNWWSKQRSKALRKISAKASKSADRKAVPRFFEQRPSGTPDTQGTDAPTLPPGTLRNLSTSDTPIERRTGTASIGVRLDALHATGYMERPTGVPTPDPRTQPPEIDPNNPKKRSINDRIIRDSVSLREFSLHDLTHQRIHCAYRIARELCRIKGLVADDELLVEAMHARYVPASELRYSDGSIQTGLVNDPWTVPQPSVKKDGTCSVGANTRNVVMYLAKAENISTIFRNFVMVSKDDKEAPHFYQGASICPPGPPITAYVKQDPKLGLRHDYEPTKMQDPNLHAWIEILQATARSLRIEDGAVEDQKLGRYGLIGLNDPDLVRLCYPNPIQLMTHEAILVEEFLEMFIEHGRVGMVRRIERKWGFRPHESAAFLKMVQARAKRLTEGDVEDHRGVMILQLEDIAQRARASLDLRAELAARKNLAVVLGLARVEPENIFSEFTQMVAAANSQKMLPPGED